MSHVSGRRPHVQVPCAMAVRALDAAQCDAAEREAARRVSRRTGPPGGSDPGFRYGLAGGPFRTMPGMTPERTIVGDAAFGTPYLLSSVTYASA